MPIHISRLFRNFAGTKEMQQVFSPKARVAHFLRIQVALAKVEASLQIIPESAYQEIARRAPGLQVNWDRLRRESAAGGHPALPLIQQLGEACGSAAEYLHWGSTARQVSDTAFVLQMCEGMSLVERDALHLQDLLRRMSEAYPSAIMMPRKPDPPSLPVTFGFRCAGWCREIDRQLGRLARVRANLLGDSLGTANASGPLSSEVRAALLGELVLAPPTVPEYALRDRICDCVFVLATLSSALASMASTVSSMADGEIQELRTVAFDTAQGACSQVCEQIIAHAEAAAGNVSIVMESTLRPHDAQRQNTLETELVPQTFLLVHQAVGNMCAMLAGLEVCTGRMRSNIENTKGLVMAESVMQVLAGRSGRRSAHRLVSRACESALRDDLSLREALLRSKDVTALMSPDEIDHALDPASHVWGG